MDGKMKIFLNKNIIKSAGICNFPFLALSSILYVINFFSGASGEESILNSFSDFLASLLDFVIPFCLIFKS